MFRPDWNNFYPWPDTINKMEGAGALGCMVIGANDLGKTFGLRYLAVKRALEREDGSGRQFAEICRNEKEVSSIAEDYCTKLKQVGFFPKWDFASKKGVITAVNLDTSQHLTIGYVVSLTSRTQSKRVTYPDIGYTIMDECVIEFDDRYHDYLKDEWSKLERLCVALWREVPNRKSPSRLFLLGNSVDLACPYFERLKIGIPEYGQRWCLGKTWLFDYAKSSGERLADLKQTNAYRLFEGADRSAMFNEFSQSNDAYLGWRTDDALYGYTIVLFDCRFGVWRGANGIYYISRKIPKDYESFPVFALTRDDATPDYELARISSPRIKFLIRAYIHGNIRFDNSLTREKFMRVFSMFGLR